MKKLQYLITTLLLLSCNNINKFQGDKHLTDGQHALDSTEIPEKAALADEKYMHEEKEREIVVLWETDLPEGKHRKFGQIHEEYTYKLIAIDKTSEVYIPTPYYRYDDGEDFYADGIHEPFHYSVSPDSKYLYLVTAVQANGSGWVTEYQLYKINVSTLECKMITECAAIEATGTGFKIAKDGLDEDDTASCTLEEKMMVHDEYLDWEGNTVKIDKNEYFHDVMVSKYPSPTGEGSWVRVVGFERKDK